MTRTTNARIAGFTFLFYIAVGIPSVILFSRAASGRGIAEKLATISQHATDLRIVFLLTLLQAFCAFVLAVTLYAITREQDQDLAMLGLAFRVGEGLIGLAIPTSLALLWLAASTEANAFDAGSPHTVGAFLLQLGTWQSTLAATFFAIGSSFFSWLLLRGRMIPITLAWLGVIASLLLVVGLPLEAAGFLRGPAASLLWIPMVAFEVPLALWLLIKGVAMPARRISHAQ